MEIPPKKPHFFKPILPGFKNGLKIPIGFLKYLKGHDHIEHAILRRAGKKWLVKANGRRLEEGDWKEFVEVLNLELGDILVFKHEGKMEFEVSVFDSSHCDRGYVEYMQMEEEEEDNKEEDDHEDEEEDEVDVEEEDKNKKDEGEDEDDEEEEEDMVDEDEEDENDEDEDDEDEEEEDEDYNERDKEKYEDENDEDMDEEGEEAATHDKPLGQSHFECTIRQYCLSKGFMWIPKHFASVNGLIKGNKKCGLIIIDERQTRLWNLTLSSSKTQVYITGDGWRKFSTDNCLKEGDHIIFETVNNGETPIWKFRVVRDVETPTRKFQEKPKAKINTSGKAAKDMHLSDHSHFICTIKPYCLSKHFLCIPKQFARENRLNNRKCKVIMRDEQQSWTFNVYTTGQNTYFGSEWHEFCNTNCLKEGDCVMFEIISKGETPIFRFHDLRGSPSVQPEVKKKKSNAERMSSDKGLERKNLGTTTLKSQLASSTSVDANSHFISTIKPYTISHPILHLPMDFVKSNGLMHRREMILIDGKQRSWSLCVGRKGRHHFAIKRGWRQFRNANGVQVGDTYKFELINNGTIPIVHFHCKYSGN